MSQSNFEIIINKPRDQRTPLEQCIVDAANLEDMRDGDYTQMEVAANELQAIRDKQFEGLLPYEIANAAVDDLFKRGDFIAAQLELQDADHVGHGGWGKNPARDIIQKHIQAAIDAIQKPGQTLKPKRSPHV